MASSPVGRALSAVEGGFGREGDLGGRDGAEGESSLQAAVLAASRRAEAKSAQVPLAREMLIAKVADVMQ